MPLYEFECSKCEETVEILVRSPDSDVSCPDCGDERLTRVMSATAAPSIGSSKDTLPVAGRGESCEMPRCCGGICQ